MNRSGFFLLYAPPVFLMNNRNIGHYDNRLRVRCSKPSGKSYRRNQ